LRLHAFGALDGLRVDTVAHPARTPARSPCVFAPRPWIPAIPRPIVVPADGVRLKPAALTFERRRRWASISSPH